MKGTRPLDNDEIRSLGLEGGLNFRWQYTSVTTPEAMTLTNEANAQQDA